MNEKDQIKLLKKSAEECLKPLSSYRRDCHLASITLDRAGIGVRVARGFCRSAVARQHSWVVCGMDCYDNNAIIIDPTLWSWNKGVKGIYVGDQKTHGHVPHGAGNIWRYGKPERGGGELISLTPKTPLSEIALAFLEMVGPLDIHGWHTLAHSPVQGWPAAEIVSAIEDTMPGVVSIDIVGMLTDRNPQKLYLK